MYENPYLPELDERRDLRDEGEDQMHLADLRAQLEEMSLDGLSKEGLILAAMRVYPDLDGQSVRKNLSDAIALMGDFAQARAKKMRMLLDES